MNRLNIICSSVLSNFFKVGDIVECNDSKMRYPYTDDVVGLLENGKKYTIRDVKLTCIFLSGLPFGFETNRFKKVERI